MISNIIIFVNYCVRKFRKLAIRSFSRPALASSLKVNWVNNKECANKLFSFQLTILFSLLILSLLKRILDAIIEYNRYKNLIIKLADDI